MKRPWIKRLILQGLTWSAVFVCSAFLALAQSGTARTDGQIEMDVVHALDAAQPLKDDLITAATMQSEVTLSGTVASEGSRKLAESVVAKVDGVTKVHNNLKVGNPQQAAEAQNLSMSDASDQSQTADNAAQPAQSAAYPQQGHENSPAQQGQYADQDQYAPQQPPAPGEPARPAYPQQPAGYAYAQPQRQAFRPAPGPLTVPQGTLLQLRTNEAVASKRAKNGEPVEFVVISDIYSGGYLAIPRGATVHGVITGVQNAKRGDLGGSAALALQLTTLELGGQSYPLQSDEFRVKGPNKAGRTAGSAIGGALLGALIGGAAGGGTGAAIGAGVGAGAGTAASAATNGPEAWIPAEARLDFHMLTPITVNPVSEQEALRLAQGLYPGGPTLYHRGGGYPPPPGYYAPAPYYYGPVYYRPYTVMGGYYVWR